MPERRHDIPFDAIKLLTVFDSDKFFQKKVGHIFKSRHNKSSIMPIAVFESTHDRERNYSLSEEEGEAQSHSENFKR